LPIVYSVMQEEGMPLHERLVVSAWDTTLVAERWGELPAKLVLLHPGVADRRCWHAVVPEIEPLGTVVTYDLRGYGHSPRCSGSFSHLDDLLTVLDSVASAPVWLVGSSLGGGIALDAAVAHQDRIAGLVLLAPAVSGASEPELDPETERFDRRMGLAEAGGDQEELNRLTTWLWLDGPLASEGRVPGPARELATEMIAAVNRNRSPEPGGTSGVDAWSRLKEIQIPVTVACGDLDVPYLVSRSEELAARISGARFQSLHDTAHLPYLEAPAAVARIVVGAMVR
jgi:pimeloyl-ACP methyl ester carboxylesterase